MKQFSTLLICMPLFTTFAPKVIHAQLPPKAKIYATGLDGPRGLKFGPDGKLYVSNLGAVPEPAPARSFGSK